MFLHEKGALLPTAHEIAVAIVAAARLHDEDALNVATGAPASRARWLAFAALLEEFPGVHHRALSTWTGFGGSYLDGARSLLAFNRRNQKWKWWADADFLAVKAELAAARKATDVAAPPPAARPSLPAVIAKPVLHSSDEKAQRAANPLARVIDRRPEDGGIVPLGEPDFERSALHQRLLDDERARRRKAEAAGA